MTRLSEDMFANFPRLRFLDVGNNFLTVLDGGSLGSLPNLVFLFLDNNYIASVADETLTPETRDGLKDLTLYGNRLVCSCDLLWLQEWLRRDPGLFQSDRYEYVCDSIPDTNITDFPLPQQACMMKREVSSFIIGVCSLIIFTFTFATLFFAYRWHLRLLCVEAFRGQGERRRQRLAQKQFDFDIFVSYESEDLPWVRKYLMTELEDRQGLKLCIHQRDFIPGHYIVDNIADSVESSKKVLMVFSKSFVLSQWCQFELTYCLSHVMDYDDSLIVVYVDDVVSRDMTGPMMAVLKTTTYIQWEEAPQDAVRAFWGRMRLALAEILPRRPANPPVNRRAIDPDTGVNPPANLDNRPANPAGCVNPPANRLAIDPADTGV